MQVSQSELTDQFSFFLPIEQNRTKTLMAIAFIDIAHFLTGFYSLLLILIGTPLNLLCFYIYKCLIPNRTNPTIIVFAHLALIELLVPFTWNMNYVVRELFWKYQKSATLKNLEGHSLFVCKLISFAAYFSLQCAAWLKTLATFARCVTVHHGWSMNKWLSKANVIQRVIWCVIFLIGLINFPIWIVNGEAVPPINQLNETTKEIRCYQSRFFKYWEIVHLLLYNFLPFTLMIICNIMITRQVKDSHRRTQRSKMTSRSSNPSRSSVRFSGGRLTKTLILITVFFILFTSPAAIFYIFLDKRIIKTHRNIITMNLSNLATTSHVTSFFIYWLISSDFRDAAISVLCCRPINTNRASTTTPDDRQLDKSASNQQSSTHLKNTNERKLPLLQSSLVVD